MTLTEFFIFAIYLCHITALIVFVQYVEERRVANRKIYEEQEAKELEVEDNEGTSEQEDVEKEEAEDGEGSSEQEDAEKEEVFTMSENPMFVHREEVVSDTNTKED